MTPIVPFGPLLIAPGALVLRAENVKVGRFERIEFTIDAGRRYVNPFDPRQVDLRLEIVGPGGEKVIVPAFYAQRFERRLVRKGEKTAEWVYPVGEPVWLARFSPSEAGKYSCVAVLEDGEGTRRSNAVSFECVPSARRGFIRVSRPNPRYLEFPDGRPFFPIGQNLAFIGPSQYVGGAYDVERIFRKMAECGANFARIWACCEDWAMAIEARKSAWGRSWLWRPPIAAMPGREGYLTGRLCVRISGGERDSVRVSPPREVALRPGREYVISGRMRSDGEAGLEVEVNGRRLDPIPPSRKWARFERGFKTRDDEWWLSSLVLRLTGSGTVWLDRLSLKEAGGGPELLPEADPNGPAIGRYNQLDCFLLDKVVEAAERCGVYLQICLLTRDLYMPRLRDARSPEYRGAIEDAKRLLRYAVARWGYSTAVVAWEYFNELDPRLPAGRFYDELGRFLEEVDVYRHLRTTSSWAPNPGDWRHPRLDLAEMHWYMRPSWGELWKDAAGAVLDRAKFLLEGAPEGKPALLAEFGLATDRWGQSPYMKEDRELVHFHNALWASALSGLAGTAMFWWWEALDMMDAYRHYKPLAEFLSDVPFTRPDLRKAAVKTSSRRCRVVGLQCRNGAWLWVSNGEATWWRTVVEGRRPRPVEGATLKVEGLKPGRYRVVWWDTWAGGVLRKETVRTEGNSLVLRIPPFERDIACKAVGTG